MENGKEETMQTRRREEILARQDDKMGKEVMIEIRKGKDMFRGKLVGFKGKLGRKPSAAN